MKLNNKILVIIPFKDKEKYLISFIDYLKEHNELFDFIFIDNASSDRSQEILKLNKISFIDSSYRLSYTKALKIGLEYAKLSGYETIIEYGDFIKYKPISILKLISAFKNFKCDLILGHGINLKRKRIFQSQIFKFSNFLITGKWVKGIDSKIKIFNKKILNYVDTKPNYALRPDDVTFLILDKNNSVKTINILLEPKTSRKSFWKVLSNYNEAFIWVLFMFFVIPFRKKIKNEKDSKNEGDI
ncbi:glycosyltransferase [[Mycoplasma] mobile]|uniref:Glycosyltransferase 2-like domain-containing protein n=1 Tax=Mycoplasma mobile (strain ATCC 43663 / 163K / NCTC 11711) TaxID=267748 RepID=Q6KHH0_MYCM1|nr:glycosyltransferase [[Mycoplasma] mobile]AAT27960.1 conserved hypothetical protein [Mycoplasma mobile 163K]